MPISIHFGNPDALYYSGQAVSGTLDVELDDDVRSITIEARGKAYCHWTTSESSPETENGAHSRLVSYSSTVNYCNLKAVAWQSRDDETKHRPGLHQFPFNFVLIPECPPSYEGKNGYIRYEIIVKIDRVLGLESKYHEYFKVLPLVDINRIPQALVPVVDHQSKAVGMKLFRHGYISYEARINKIGFILGETITIDATIENASTRPVTFVTAKLKQWSHFTAFRNGSTTDYYSGMSLAAGGTTRENKLVIAKLRGKVNMEPSSSQKIQLSLEVPPTVPSFDTCPTISVEYYVSFQIESEGTFNNKIKSKFPIIVGTIPISSDQSHSSASDLPPDLNQVLLPSEDERPLPYPDADEPLQSAPPPTYEDSVYGKRDQ